ncbi:MAG: bifunctional nicotinamidase/pyrazinamidase [Gemmataceae bacterium]|nr:bifunctional nicotinamidase/pyrazinamidase [Gemmataceae bacterium]
MGGCTLLSRIGKGGMGVVYKARHHDLDLDVAVKLLHPRLTLETGTTERFLREARLAARLQSPGIVRVFNCGETEGHYYIVMEYIDGQTLAAHLKERGAVPVARALQIGEAVAAALREALSQIGLIHRDVKPANILLTRSGQVKLADLGLAKIATQPGADFQTAAGVALGTPSYMSPEQFADAGRVDHRADIFSLGATLYEMVAGRPPFRGDSFLAIMKQISESDPVPLPGHVPAQTRALIGRLMNKRPEDRFDNYDELMTAIQAAHRSLGEMDERVSQDIACAAGPSMIPQVVLSEGHRHASPTENRVLLVVDIQNDFCPQGALAVAGGDEVVPIINKLSRRFAHVILTQDWHCEDHLSFASSHPGKKPLDRVTLPYGEQILWPDHCVERTLGAEFQPQLDVAHCELVLRKGYHRDIDSYSAFFENDRRTPTGLTGYLRERGLTRLFLVGLATDFCVAYSALDARRLGFEVTVIEAACRGIDVGGSLAAAWRDMEQAGVIRA